MRLQLKYGYNRLNDFVSGIKWKCFQWFYKRFIYLSIFILSENMFYWSYYLSFFYEEILKYAGKTFLSAINFKNTRRYYRKMIMPNNLKPWRGRSIYIVIQRREILAISNESHSVCGNYLRKHYHLYKKSALVSEELIYLTLVGQYLKINLFHIKRHPAVLRLNFKLQQRQTDFRERKTTTFNKFLRTIFISIEKGVLSFKTDHLFYR